MMDNDLSMSQFLNKESYEAARKKLLNSKTEALQKHISEESNDEPQDDMIGAYDE